jgi:hypothetical protein
MQIHAGVSIRARSAGWQSSQPGCWLAALLAFFGLAIFVGVIEIGGATPAEAQPCVCPAGYTVQTAGGGIQYCLGPNGQSLSCGELAPETVQKAIQDLRRAAQEIRNQLRGPYGTASPGDISWAQEEIDELETLGNAMAQAAAQMALGGGPGGGGSGHLGMYTSPYGDIGAGGAVDGFGMTGKGVNVTDSSGSLGSTSSFNATGAGGGVYGSVDVTPQFKVGGAFDYQRVWVNAVGAGSAELDDYRLTGYFKYYWPDTYARGLISYDFGPTHVFDAGTSGSYNTNALSADLKAGHVFTLVDALTRPSSSKGAPPSGDYGYGVLLDLSAHTGLYSSVSDAFVDSSGYAWGDGYSHFGAVGTAARLELLLPRPGILWMPYIQANVDQLFAYRDVQDVIAQGGAAADVLYYGDATTFAGGTIGISAQTRPGWSVGISAFYDASADSHIVGGQGFVKVQF